MEATMRSALTRKVRRPGLLLFLAGSVLLLPLQGCDNRDDGSLEPSSTGNVAGNTVDPSDKTANTVDLGAPPASPALAALFSAGATAGNVTPIPFAPEPGPFANRVANCDDCVSPGLPIGFDFEFFGNTYTTFNVSSNGFISFGSGSDNGCCSGRPSPPMTASTTSSPLPGQIFIRRVEAGSSTKHAVGHPPAI
jgi:hypothetical protein